MDYPAWVEFVTLFGLDPVTVWFEYRWQLFALIGAAVLASLLLLWLLARQIIVFAARFHYSFSDRMPFYRHMEEIDHMQHERLGTALAGEEMVFGMPAIAAADVPGFRNTVGFLLLTSRRLIFVPKEGGNHIGASFPLESFPDANIKDGLKNVELKLIQADRKPLFQLLGVSRDHAQELFMKMHVFRQSIQESQQT